VRSSERGAGSGGTLVIQTAFLGDVVLTIPLLVRLAERHGPVDVVTTLAAAPLIETHPAVAAVIRYDKAKADRGLAGFRALAATLRAKKYARAYLPHRSWRTAMLAVAARIHERTGFGGSPAAMTYTVRIRRPEGVHESVRLLALAGGAKSPDAHGARPTLRLTEQDHERVGAWLAERGVAEPFIALAPGSIWGTKRWPGFPALAAALAERVVVVGAPDDRPLGEAIVTAAPGRAWNAAGELSLRQSAALIERARVLVTNDSAPLHLASGVGTRIVALFGPTVPAFGFGPVGEQDSVVEVAGLPCRPCSRHGPQVCPLGHHRCMRELSVERVIHAIHHP
jgi:lipopolysaccharide heptosyltransferase II